MIRVPLVLALTAATASCCPATPPTTTKETSMTDHTMLADADLDTAARAIRRSDLTEVEVITATLALAHVHATLAVAEQARIANLVALSSLAGRDEDAHEEVATAAYGALTALIRYRDVPNGHAGPDEVAVLRPDIAAALGIEAVDHD